jgi:hypothetical protein
MRKAIAIIVCVAAFLIPLNVFAWDSGGWDSGRFSAGLTGTGFTGGGATDMPSGITAILLNYSLIKKTYAIGTNEAGTLADGIVGQVIKITIDCDNPSGSYILTPTTKTGFRSLTFAERGDQATLLFLDNINGWIIIGETGVTVNQ